MLRAVLLGLLILASPTTLANPRYLLGKVGEFPIGVSLQETGGSLSGWYFYLSQGKQIRLEGRIDTSGAFRLEETLNGKKTGVFEGRIQAEHWVGTWRKAAGAAPLALDMEENRTQLVDETGEYACSTKERDKEAPYTYHSKLKLSLNKGHVKTFSAEQGSIGDDQDEQGCAIALGDLKQTPSQAGLLLIAQGDTPKAKAGHCSIRLIGNASTLWVQVGDATQAGNDCRSADDSMFCSPRAFWNDIVFDRQTRKCKRLK